jgi:hypothetical protein
MQRHGIENTAQVPFLSGLTDHSQACYGGNACKSMKREKLAMSRKDGWRNIAITLTTP